MGRSVRRRLCRSGGLAVPDCLEICLVTGGWSAPLDIVSPLASLWVVGGEALGRLGGFGEEEEARLGGLVVGLAAVGVGGLRRRRRRRRRLLLVQLLLLRLLLLVLLLLVLLLLGRVVVRLVGGGSHQLYGRELGVLVVGQLLYEVGNVQRLVYSDGGLWLPLGEPEGRARRPGRPGLSRRHDLEGFTRALVLGISEGEGLRSGLSRHGAH